MCRSESIQFSLSNKLEVDVSTDDKKTLDKISKKLTAHETCDVHIKNIPIEDGADAEADSKQRTITTGFAIQDNQNLANVRKLMGASYFLAKRKIAGNAMPDLCLLFDYINADPGKHYRSRDMCEEWQTCFSMALMNQQLTVIRNSPCYCLSVDETTDISVTKSMIMYIRYLNPDYTAVTQYLCQIKVTSGKGEGNFNTFTSTAMGCT